MTTSRIVLGLVAVGLATAFLAGCRAGGGVTEPEYRTSAVQRGDLTVEITSSGNLVYSNEAELAFDVDGAVGEVLVEVGDRVEQRQVLARVDADEWQDYLDGLADKIESAEQAVDNAENGVTTAQQAVISAERKLAASGSSLLQAEISVKSAELALKKADEAPSHIRDEDDIAIKELQVELAEMRLAEAETAVLDAEQGVADAVQAVADAEDAVADAEVTLAEARREWLDAWETNTEIVAPFDGVITTVSVSASDVVKKGRPVIVLSDPGRYEATMLINEIDILQVQVGALAIIEIDAVPGTNLPARVTGIAPAATAQQGVVNYRVTAELQSIDLAASPRVGQDEDAPPADQSSVDDVLARAVADGRLTQEQADLMKQRFPAGGVTISGEQLEQLIDRFAQGGGGGFRQRGNLTPEQQEELRERSGTGRGFGQGLADGQVAGGLSLRDVQLRAGLSVTVRIITQQRTNVLLVPNQAIQPQGLDTYVELLVDGFVEPRQVVIGISDWQFTEIIDGLSEGDQVITGLVTDSPPEPSEAQQPAGFGLFRGGGGRFTR